MAQHHYSTTQINFAIPSTGTHNRRLAQVYEYERCFASAEKDFSIFEEKKKSGANDNIFLPLVDKKQDVKKKKDVKKTKTRSGSFIFSFSQRYDVDLAPDISSKERTNEPPFLTLLLCFLSLSARFRER